MKIGSSVRPERVPEKKGQSKKSQRGNISPRAYMARSPTVLIRIKICMVGSLPDIITCAKFQAEIFRGYDTTWEFPISY